MRCTFKRKYFIKFVFMFLAVIALAALFINLYTSFTLDELRRRDKVTISIRPHEQTYRRSLGEYSKISIQFS